MKRILCLILTMLAGLTLATAQSVQDVVVKEYNAKNQKTPLSGVGLTVTNAGATMSDAQGQASLRFRTLKAGDRVQVRRVELAGYEVFNTDAVAQWTVSPSVAFQLVMCRSDLFRQLRDQYQRVASASYDRQYRADQARLQAQHRAGQLLEEQYQQQLQALTDQYEQQLEDLDNYVEQFARIDLSELSAQQQHLVELVQQGQIDDAIALYESHDYLGQYQRESHDLQTIEHAQQQLAAQQQQLREQRQAVMASIERQVGTYQLAGGLENFAKVTALLKGMADADTTCYAAVWRYATYAMRQGRLDESKRYLDICLRLCGHDKVQLLSVHNELFNLYLFCRQSDKAEPHLRQALTLLQELSASAPRRYQAHMVDALLRLHTFYVAYQRYAEADGVYRQCCEAYAALSSDDLEANVVLRRHLCDAEHSVSMVAQGHDVAQAESLALAGVQAMESVCRLDDDEQAEIYLSALQQVMTFYEVQEKWEAQLPILERSVVILQSLAKRNPERQQISYFEALANLADTYVQMQRPAEAWPHISQALALVDELRARHGAEFFAPNEMGFYDSVASYYLLVGDAAQSQRYAQLCMKAYDLMPEDIQQAYEEVAHRWRK